MALMGVDFSPRIKDIKDRTLYGDKPSSHYRSMGYKIYPTCKISWSDVESQWDQILRMMASILSGHCLASQIFNRINSYSIDHPLYKALKALGRIEKTNFILRYQGNDSLRDRIQKQLNLGEQSNRFAKAICWADARELRGQTIQEFERATACTQLIQNCVILWNYMYVTKRLLAMDLESRNDIIQKLSSGQMMAWEHVNFTGIFHFSSRSMPSQQFDLNELSSAKFNTPEAPDSFSDWPDDLDEDVLQRDILPEFSV
jgi:TnpA family transposase